MDWTKCVIKMQKGSMYNSLRLTKDVEIIQGVPYVNGVKSSWEDVTESRTGKQRIINRSFTNIKNMTVRGNEITIDGKPMNEWLRDNEKLNIENEVIVVNITINGNVEKLKADYCETIEIHGDTGNVETRSGSVTVNGNIKGDVDTMSGSVKANIINGDVSTMSGSIHKF